MYEIHTWEHGNHMLFTATVAWRSTHQQQLALAHSYINNTPCISFFGLL